MARPNEERGAFRCAIPPENSSAQLKIGKKCYQVSVLDTSRTGFTVVAPNRVAKKLKEKAVYQLSFSGEKWEVGKRSSYRENDRDVHVGFHRIRELTKLKPPKSSLWDYAPKFDSNADPSFLMFLIVVFVIACVSLPGIGDGLGTAPKVRDGVRAVLGSIRDTMK